MIESHKSLVQGLQLFNCCGQYFGDFAFQDSVFGFVMQLRIGNTTEIIQRLFMRLFLVNVKEYCSAPFKMIQAGIVGNLSYPCRQFSLKSEIGKLTKSFHVNFLSNVSSIFAVLDHLEGNLRYQTFRVSYDSFKGLRVTCQDLFDQVPICKMPIVFVVQWEMRPESPGNVAIESTKLGFAGS